MRHASDIHEESWISYAISMPGLIGRCRMQSQSMAPPGLMIYRNWVRNGENFHCGRLTFSFLLIRCYCTCFIRCPYEVVFEARISSVQTKDTVYSGQLNDGKSCRTSRLAFLHFRYLYDSRSLIEALAPSVVFLYQLTLDHQVNPLPSK